jgi:hypothetical protein
MIQPGEAAGFEERIGRNSALRKVCAWCHTVMKEGEDPATHGICLACQEKEMLPYLKEPTKGGVG